MTSTEGQSRQSRRRTFRRREATTAAALLACAGLALSAAGPAAATRPTDGGGSKLAAAVKRYAPLVYLAKGETNRPMSASTYVRWTELRWAHDSGCGDHRLAARGDVVAAKLGSGGYSHQIAYSPFRACHHHGRHYSSNELTRPAQDGKDMPKNEGFFLDLPNKDSLRHGQGTGAPVYYEYAKHSYVTYWFFYAYNDSPGGKADNHEGDWERISVQLDSQDHARTVAFYEHSGYCTVGWNDVRKDRSGHPTAYSAIGSHATYPRVGSFPTEVPLVRDHTSAGAQWPTYRHLQSAQAQGWYGFGGAWGDVGEVKVNPHSTGPLGPSGYKDPAPGNWNKPCDG